MTRIETKLKEHSNIKINLDKISTAMLNAYLLQILSLVFSQSVTFYQTLNKIDFVYSTLALCIEKSKNHKITELREKSNRKVHNHMAKLNDNTHTKRIEVEISQTLLNRAACVRLSLARNLPPW